MAKKRKYYCWINPVGEVNVMSMRQSIKEVEQYLGCGYVIAEYLQKGYTISEVKIIPVKP